MPPPIHGEHAAPDAQGATRRSSGRSRRSSAFLGVPPERFIKTLLYVTDTGETVAALVRGDHELSEVKLQQAPRLPVGDDGRRRDRREGTPAPRSASPDRSGCASRMLADHAHARPGRARWRAPTRPTTTSSTSTQARDLPDARRSPTCAPRSPAIPARAARTACTRAIAASRSATSSTSAPSTAQAMRATFLDADGEEQPMEMGCYGIGITRTAAAAIEQNHDDNGIIWPLALAPAQVHLDRGERQGRGAAARRRALYARADGSRRRGAARRPRRAAGREVQGRRPDRHPAARHRRRQGAGARRRRAQARAATPTAQELPLADAVERAGRAGAGRDARDERLFAASARRSRADAQPADLRARRRVGAGGDRAGEAAAQRGRHVQGRQAALPARRPADRARDQASTAARSFSISSSTTSRAPSPRRAPRRRAWACACSTCTPRAAWR